MIFLSYSFLHQLNYCPFKKMDNTRESHCFSLKNYQSARMDASKKSSQTGWRHGNPDTDNLFFVMIQLKTLQ